MTAAAASAEPVLRTEAITKVYRSGAVEVHALRGVDFALAAGELIVLVGPSGSGKSTLLNIIGFYRDWELTAAREADLTRYRRDHVGFVFQFYNLIPSLTALENVALVTEIAERPMAAEDALALVRLQDRMDHFPAQLSGGEQQRVAIARALVHAPALVLADEPTGNLDKRTGEKVGDLLFELHEESDSTLVVATHDARMAKRCDRVLQLDEGRLIQQRGDELLN